MEHINNYINENKDRFINELIELLKIPSISADPAYKVDVLNCADAVAKAMKDAGADNIEICKTEGYPIVYGEKIIDTNLPTVLVLSRDETSLCKRTTATRAIQTCVRETQAYITTRRLAHACKHVDI